MGNMFINRRLVLLPVSIAQIVGLCVLYLLVARSCISKANFCSFKHQNYTHLLTYVWIAADTGQYK